MVKKVIDTNILIESPEIILDGNCVVPGVIFRELENIKISHTKSEDVKYKARRSIRLLNENADKFQIFVIDNNVYDIVTSKNLPHSNDNLILACAYKLKQEGSNVVVISNDGCARFVAQSCFSLKAESHIVGKQNSEYKGYKEVCVNDNELAHFYENLNRNIYGCYTNEYLILKNMDSCIVDKLKWDGENFTPLKIPRIRDFKPLNLQQELAFDLLGSDTPIKLLLGNSGSGKTFLNLRFALQAVQKGKVSRILYLRDPIGKGSQIGYLPGSKLEKMSPFLSGVIDNLDMGEIELQNMINSGSLIVDSPFFLKGSSKENTWFLVDEAEDLDVDMLKLIGTRISKGSCICLSGDLMQTENRYKSNNGLETFIEKFKDSPLVGIVKLKEDMRSEASKLFNSL